MGNLRFILAALVTTAVPLLAGTFTLSMTPIRINEVQLNAETAAGWVELFNPTTVAVDMSHWILTTIDASPRFSFPAGTMISPRGYLVVDEANFPLGLRAAGRVHLFSRLGVQVDAFVWTSSPANSYGRCPDGTGAFVPTTSPTRASANVCPASVSELPVKESR